MCYAYSESIQTGHISSDPFRGTITFRKASCPSEPQFSQAMGQTRTIPLRRALRVKSVSMEHILMLFAGIKALEEVNIEIIMGVIKRHAGPPWFSWEQTVLSTSQKQNVAHCIINRLWRLELNWPECILLLFHKQLFARGNHRRFGISPHKFSTQAFSAYSLVRP